jgi:mannose-6-phosphate isomerase-like protein (cupin superfamily)
MLDMQYLRDGEGVPLHVNDHADELLVVLEGEVSIQCGDKRVVAGPGSMIFAPKGAPRSWFAVGNQVARTLKCIYPSQLDLPAAGVP